jgi:uncharacterized protein YpmS
VSDHEGQAGSYPSLGGKRRPSRKPWWIWLALLLLILLIAGAVILAIIALDDDVDAPTSVGATTSEGSTQMTMTTSP